MRGVLILTVAAMLVAAIGVVPVSVAGGGGSVVGSGDNGYGQASPRRMSREPNHRQHRSRGGSL